MTLPKIRRREQLTVMAALLVGCSTKEPLPMTQTSTQPTTQPQPGARGSGRSGDFDFLSGRWSIKNRRLKQRGVPLAQQVWETFDSDATCWTVLGGLGSIEELRIPVGKPRGLGIRLLDAEKSFWSDYWVPTGAGQVVPPPMWGEFKDGVGVFISTDEREGDVTVRSRGMWDRITPTSCRWYQGSSSDSGKTWEDNWFMDWTRVA
jgi:hypothetical protein